MKLCTFCRITVWERVAISWTLPQSLFCLNIIPNCFVNFFENSEPFGMAFLTLCIAWNMSNRSVKQTNHESLYKNGVTFRGKNGMLLSLLEMQLRERVWTEQLLKRLSIVILDVLRVPRRREIKIKYIFLVKVPLVFKKSSKRRSMWM